MTKHRYGKFSDMQMSEIKKTLRGSIFFLLQCDTRGLYVIQSHE